jgi:hypothetical protein
MHSHRRPRGRILFEAVCALTAGVSFVGAWIQTGAWAFIGPAFIFTLFGLYWAIDLFGQGGSAVAAQSQGAPAPAPARAADPEPAASRDSAVMPEIRFARFEAPAAPAPEPIVDHFDEPEAHTDVVPFVSEPVVAPVPAPVASAEPQPRAKKTRAKKVAEPVVAPAPAPVQSAAEQHDQHIEQLFDPQPFARQARPAFGKRSRGPGGSRPLPA